MNLKTKLASIFNVSTSDIKLLTPLFGGMSNDNFTFEINGRKYVVRVPTKASNVVVNRHNEAKCYEQLEQYDFVDELVFIEPDTGFKITRYIENVGNCDHNNQTHVKHSIELMKAFHDLNLQVEHRFDFLEYINKFESLCDHNPPFEDYTLQKQNAVRLLNFVNSLEKKDCLTHIDFTSANIIMRTDTDPVFIDMEYAGMQDPHVDIGMFITYAGYSKKQADELIAMYFGKTPDSDTIHKIYAYIALSGILWTAWSQWREESGADFGEYPLKQYTYARVYSKLVLDYLDTKVDNAIIMAAGRGSRLSPFTNHTHKALIKVNGQPMIESSIEALISQGITNITIVVGYLKEQFEYLKDKYNVTLLENKDVTQGSLSSIYTARHRLKYKNTIVLEADLVITNKNIFKTHIKRSGYSSFFKDSTDEWVFQIDSNNKITQFDKSTNKSGYVVRGISHWTKLDSVVLAERIKELYETSEDKSLHFDDVHLVHFKDEFDLYVDIINEDDSIEIDTAEELMALDSSYRMEDYL